MNICRYIMLGGILLMLALFNACKTSEPSEVEVPDDLPASYDLGNDTANLSKLNWKVFFGDSNLTQLIDTALKYNFDVLIAMQRIESSRSNVLFRKGSLMPMFSASASFAQRKYGLYTMDGAGNKSTEITIGKTVPVDLHDYYLGLQCSWEIDIWGKLHNRKNAAVARYLGSVEGKNLVITNLVAEVAFVYYILLSLDEELRFIRETIKLQEQALSLVRIQKQTGGTNELAVQLFESQWLNSKGLERETLYRILEAENRVNFLLGRYPQEIPRDSAAFTRAIPIDLNVGLPADLLSNRPDIRQAEFEVIATKADTKAAKAAFYPTLNITGALGFQAFKTGYWFTSPQSIAYSLFGGLTAPLINRKAIKAEFRNAKANQQVALYNYQKSIVNGYIEVYNELARIKSLEEVRDYKNREVEVLTESIVISSLLFRTGRASYLEVILAQRNALTSQLQLTEVRRRQYFSLVNIYKALGGGW